MIKGFWEGTVSKNEYQHERKHNTGNGSAVQHVLAVIHNDKFSSTALHDFISEIMHLSEPTEFTWVMKSVFQARVKNYFTYHLNMVGTICVEHHI